MHKHGLCCRTVSVCHVRTFYSSKHVFKIFSLSDSHTILVFLYQALWQYSDRDPLSGAKITIFDEYLALRSSKVITVSGSICVSHRQTTKTISESCLRHQAWTSFLSVDGYRPKTTEHNCVRIGEYEAKVTNNIRLHLRYCTVKANYRQTWDIVTAELLVIQTMPRLHSTELCRKQFSRYIKQLNFNT